MRTPMLVVLAAALMATGSAIACGDDTTGGPCTPTTCAAEGAECGAVDDGCGETLECGTCTAPDTCGADNTCGVCTPTTCAAEGAECGEIDDGCGTMLDCGTCTAPDTCGTDNQCGGACTPTTCAAEGAECGELDDGCGGTLTCTDTCVLPDTCAGAGVDNTCGCTATVSCPPAPFCGDIDDGCGGTLSCGTCGANAYFHGDFITNNTYDVGYYDHVAGVAAPLLLANLDGTDVNAMAVSADGNYVAVAGHDTNISRDFVYLYDVTDFSVATTLVDNSAIGFVVDIEHMAFSPDGSLLAFTGDIDSNQEDALYVVPTDASSPPTRVSPIPPSNGDVKALVWVDNTTLAYIGDVLIDGIDGLWSVDVTIIDPASNNVELVPAALLSATQKVDPGHIQADATGRVYFTSDHQVVDGFFQLFRVDVDGQNLEQVPGSAISAGGGEEEIGGWSLSPDGSLLAFGTWPQGQGIGQVYVMGVTQSMATAVTSFVGTAPAGVVFGIGTQPIAWNPSQTLIAFTGDWQVGFTGMDDSNSAFVAPVVGPAAIRIFQSVSAAVSYDAFRCYFSTDGNALFVLGDLVSDGEQDLYVTSDFVTPDQDPNALQIVSCPDSGDVSDFLPTVQ